MTEIFYGFSSMIVFVSADAAERMILERIMNKRIVTYSFLACLNQGKSQYKDLTDIFVPLVKRTLSILYSDGVTRGLLDDIKTKFFDLYGIDVPYSILSSMVKKIALDYNIEKSCFKFNSDNSFSIDEYIFIDFEEELEEKEFDIEMLLDSYNSYLESHGHSYSESLDLFKFIDDNIIDLADIFSKRKKQQELQPHDIQMGFLNLIADNSKLYKIMKSVYIGAVISTFLYYDHGSVSSNFDLLLDTNFIVSLLDLSSLEAYDTCRRIVEISQTMKNKVRVLNFTIEEAKALLNRKAADLNDFHKFESLNSRDILNACCRRKITNTDLERIAINLEKTLTKEFKILILKDQNELRVKAQNSSHYEKIKSYRHTNPDGILHDATACMYVEDRRKTKIYNFNDAKYWFVSDTPFTIPVLNDDKSFSETISADQLLNIMWLSNPVLNQDIIADLGLKKIITNSTNSKLPSSLLLRQLDTNIKKYAIEKIEPEDLVHLSNTIALTTVLNSDSLSDLNQLAEKSPGEFVQEIVRLNEISQEIVSVENIKLNNQLEQIANTLNAKINTAKEQSDMESAKIKKELQKTFLKMKDRKEKLDYKVPAIYKYRIIICIAIFLLYLMTITLLIYKLTWNVVEPYTYILGLIYVFASYLIASLQSKSLNPLSFFNKDVIRDYVYEKYLFDNDEYLELESRVNSDKNSV